MNKIEPKIIEEIAEKVAVSVRGVTQEQVKQIIEEKMKSQALGYRAIGKHVGLKKDKVMETWKKCEPMITLAETTARRPIDEGELFADAFSFIERLLKKGLKIGDISVELVKSFKIVPDKAKEIVGKYFSQKNLNIVDLEDKIKDIDTDVWELKERLELAFHHVRREMKSCPYYRVFDGTCRYWRWKSKPIDTWIRNDMVEDKGEWYLKVSEHPEYCVTCEISIGQRVKRLETDMREVINGLNTVIDDLNVVIDGLARMGLMVKFRSIPKLK